MRKRKKALRKKLTTFFILYFTFFTLYFSANTLSKYVGKVSGDGSTTSSVAKWEVSINTDETSKDIAIIAGNTTQEYKLKVTSASEIANKYSVVVSNIPNDVTVSIDGGEAQTPVENKITFSDVGSFEANDSNSIHEHILKFDASLEADIVENTEMQLDIIFIQDEL